MYAKGQGVPKDLVRAHMWLNLAAAQGLADAADARHKVASQAGQAVQDQGRGLPHLDRGRGVAGHRAAPARHQGAPRLDAHAIYRLESGQESDYKTSANRSSSRALKPKLA
jgi:TPR repeat protein